MYPRPLVLAVPLRAMRPNPSLNTDVARAGLRPVQRAAGQLVSLGHTKPNLRQISIEGELP